MANLILWNSSYVPGPGLIRPLGVYQLASWIRKHGYTVKVIDFCNHIDANDLVEMTSKYIEKDTLAIGVGARFWHDRPRFPKLAEADMSETSEPQWVLTARQKLDNRHPGLTWILGGGDLYFENNLKLSWQKFKGYAEDSLLNWLDYRSKTIKFRKLFDILDAQTIFTEEDYIQPFEVMPVELGRGCQFKCKFCSSPMIGKKKGTYSKRMDLLKEELLLSHQRFGTTRFQYVDDTVNDTPERVEALADIAKTLPFKIEWTGFNRIELLWSRKHTIQLMKESGCRSVIFGIESFHPKASHSIGKGWNSKYGKEFLLELREEWKNDVTMNTSFIVGLPGEELSHTYNTFEWLKANKIPSWNFFSLMIFRNPNKFYPSEFAKDYAKYGYSFPDESQPMNWKSDIMTAQEAFDATADLTEKSLPLIHNAGFFMAQIASLGYSYDDLIPMKLVDLPFHDMMIKRSNLIDNYVRAHLK